MSFYTTAIEGLPGMLLDVEDPIGNFKRKRYPTAFEAYYEQHLGTLEALENGYQQVIDKEQYLTNMAEAVAAGAEEALMREKEKQACQSSRGLQSFPGGIPLSGSPEI